MPLVFKRTASQLEFKFRLEKLNTETEQAIGVQYQTLSIPTLILFQNGQEIARQSGTMGATGIIQWSQSKILLVDVYNYCRAYLSLKLIVVWWT